MPYTVVQGDTLGAIAARNGTTWQTLQQLNGITNPNLIQPGQVIKLPSDGAAPAAPAVPSSPQVDPRVSEQGFSAAWLAAHPDVYAVVKRSIDENWGPARLEVEIKNTDWYRNLSEAERRWSTVTVEQPKQAEEMRADARRAAQQTAGLLGISLTSAQLDQFAENGAKFGWTEDDYRVAVAGTITAGNMDTGVGDIPNLIAQINAYSEQYLVGVDTGTRLGWAQAVARGDMQMEDIRSHFIRSAARLYSAVADDIRAGQTVTDIMQPYLQDAAEELGVTMATINLNDPKWLRPISNAAGKAMSREEWLTALRTDSGYGYNDTRKAKNEAAQLGNNVLTMFGMR